MSGTLALIDICGFEGHSEISKRIRSVAEMFTDQLTLTEKWLLDNAGVLHFPELHVTDEDPPRDDHLTWQEITQRMLDQ